LSEGTANTQEETCADGSAERNELDVSRLQSAMCQSSGQNANKDSCYPRDT
jgi:hypothetical protein